MNLSIAIWARLDFFLPHNKGSVKRCEVHTHTLLRCSILFWDPSVVFFYLRGHHFFWYKSRMKQLKSRIYLRVERGMRTTHIYTVEQDDWVPKRSSFEETAIWHQMHRPKRWHDTSWRDERVENREQGADNCARLVLSLTKLHSVHNPSSYRTTSEHKDLFHWECSLCFAVDRLIYQPHAFTAKSEYAGQFGCFILNWPRCSDAGWRN